jgi:hypothetical protein
MLFQLMPPKWEADFENCTAIDPHPNDSVLVVTDAEDHAMFAQRQPSG